MTESILGEVLTWRILKVRDTSILLFLDGSNDMAAEERVR